MILPTIRTYTFSLRPWTLEDAPALLALMQEAGMFRYFPPSPTLPSLEKAQRYINHHLAHWQQRGYGHWAVVTHAGELAGWNGLEYLPETDETEVAYILGQAYRGRGISTTAARAALEFGFRSAGLTSIIGLVHPENIPSIRVLEKCGLGFIDNKVYFGMEMRRYRIEKADFEACSRSWPNFLEKVQTQPGF
jgi:ribosomal-protein-alanine N-acetyltransferase